MSEGGRERGREAETEKERERDDRREIERERERASEQERGTCTRAQTSSVRRRILVSCEEGDTCVRIGSRERDMHKGTNVEQVQPGRPRTRGLLGLNYARQNVCSVSRQRHIQYV